MACDECKPPSYGAFAPAPMIANMWTAALVQAAVHHPHDWHPHVERFAASIKDHPRSDELYDRVAKGLSAALRPRPDPFALARWHAERAEAAAFVAGVS